MVSSSTRMIASFHLNPHRRHFVEDWEGIRVSITAYTVRGINSIGTEERDLLRARGFPLRATTTTGADDRKDDSYAKETHTRPKSSVRKGLWKNALKASAMITMTMSAASSYLTETFAKPSDCQVAILEIGGIEQTCYAAEIGALVSEPLSYDYVQEHGTRAVCSHIVDVKPRVLWLHPATAIEKEIFDLKQLVEAQLSGGGDVVCEAENHVAWWKDFKVEDYFNDVESQEREEHGRLVLRLRHPDTKPETVFVVNDDSGKRKTEEDKKGASAIQFDSKVAPHIRAALTRLHQNLGHPAVHDLVRHLRLAGAEGP